MSKRRAPFVITIAASVAALSACGGSTSKDNGTGGSSSGGTGAVSGSGGMGAISGLGGSSSGCPTSFPSNGSACSLPNGTSCSFSQGECCPASEAQCQDGKWMSFISTCNPPPPPPCPETPPTEGEACGDVDPCGSISQYCTYGQCADGSPSTIAECDGASWKVSFANCLPKPCEELSACECFDRIDCMAKSDGCLCECDYACPGKPPCDCICGGGTFLGCIPDTLP